MIETGKYKQFSKDSCLIVKENYVSDNMKAYVSNVSIHAKYLYSKLGSTRCTNCTTYDLGRIDSWNGRMCRQCKFFIKILFKDWMTYSPKKWWDCIVSLVDLLLAFTDEIYEISFRQKPSSNSGRWHPSEVVIYSPRLLPQCHGIVKLGLRVVDTSYICRLLCKLLMVNLV